MNSTHVSNIITSNLCDNSMSTTSKITDLKKRFCENTTSLEDYTG